MQFNYLTAPANNLNVNLVHHQQKPFVSHPYSEHYYYESSNNNSRMYNSSTPNSTIRSVKNYRKPHPPVGAAALHVPANFNVVMSTPSSNTSYQATNPMTNNLNHSYNNSNSSYKYSNNVSQSNNLNHSNISCKPEQNNAVTSNLSRRSSQSSSSHEWSEKPPSLSLCINRNNLKKSSSKSTVDKSSAQFQSMRCRKHRNRNHFFNTSTNTSYQKYKLTKSCSNDTVNSDQPHELEKNPQTTYKFI